MECTSRRAQGRRTKRGEPLPCPEVSPKRPRGWARGKLSLPRPARLDTRNNGWGAVAARCLRTFITASRRPFSVVKRWDYSKGCVIGCVTGSWRKTRRSCLSLSPRFRPPFASPASNTRLTGLQTNRAKPTRGTTFQPGGPQTRHDGGGGDSQGFGHSKPAEAQGASVRGRIRRTAMDQQTIQPQPCVMCRESDGDGQWVLCRQCRDQLKAKAKRLADDARPARCAACDYRRPSGIYCPSCAARFRRAESRPAS